MKPTTLEEALTLVPTHWPLTPGVDVWRLGDEYYSRYEGWTKAVHMSTKMLCEMGTAISYPAVRRPIPQDVRERVARNLLMSDQRGYAMSNPIEMWILAGKP